MAETTDRPDLHDEAVYRSVRDRVERLAPDSERRWGEMSPARMLAHCTEVQKVMNGGPLEGTPWYVKLAAPLVKRSVLGSRPFPKGVPTHPQYEITSEKEFESEKRLLLAALESFRARGPTPVDHPIFGRLTPEEAGWGAYKHLDHHLSQFGV